MMHPRTGQRIPVQLPVQVHWTGPSGNVRRVQGKTGNISGNGLFLTLPVRPRVATPITVTVLLPGQATRTPYELFCQGRVIRWNQRGERLGLGATIEVYELRPASRTVNHATTDA